LALGVLAGPKGSAVSPFVVDDAIVGLAQPLTESLEQLASGPRRACELIEELGRREDFCLDLAGGSSGRTVTRCTRSRQIEFQRHQDALA
jgi:hypothetical protein